jgi:hypothetical protein
MVLVMVVEKLFHTGAGRLMYLSRTIMFGQEPGMQPRRRTISARFIE